MYALDLAQNLVQLEVSSFQVCVKNIFLFSNTNTSTQIHMYICTVCCLRQILVTKTQKKSK